MSTPSKKRVAKNTSPNESLPFLALNQLSAGISSPHQLDQILTQSAQQTKKILKVKSCGIFLLNDKGILELKKGLGLSRYFQKTFDSEISQKLTREILIRTHPQISNNTLVNYKKSRSLYDLMKRENIHKEISVPLKGENRLMGVLKIWRDSSYPDFSKGDLSLLKISADQIIFAISHAKLYHQLQKSSEVYGNLIEGAPVSIVAVDSNGNITSYNKATEILTGYTKGEFMGKHFSHLNSINKDDLPRLSKLFKELLNGKKVTPLEMQMTHKNGRSYWVEVHVSRIKSKGKVIGFQINTIDTTTRRQAEKSLILKEAIATERARLLNDLRSLNRVDDILTRVCQAVRDSCLFERAVMTLHRPGGKIVNLGQVGLPGNVIERARQGSPMDDKLRSRITSPKFRISDSFFVPAEAGLDYAKTMRYVPQKRKVMGEGDWRPGDELFVPLRDFPGETMGYLSVDTPTDGCRPDVKTIQALEMLVEAAAARVREIQTHQTLHESEEKFRTLAEQSPNMIFIYQRGRVIYVNRKCEEIMGYKREEFYAPDFDLLTLIAPEDKKSVKASLRRHAMGKEVEPYEYAIITKEGKRIEAILTTKIISYLGETSVLGVITDITERKRTEETLKESENRYRNLVESALDIIYTFSPEGIITSLNPSFETITGWKIKDWIGKSFIDLIHPKELSLVMKLIQESIAEKDHPRNEFRLRKKTGDYVLLDFNANPLFKDGKFIGFVGIARDITKHKRAEENLRLSEEKFAKAFNVSPTAVFITTLKEGRFIEINRSGVNMFGYEPEEMIGRTVKQLHLWADLGDRGALIHSLQQEGAVYNMEIKLCRKSGEVFNALISVDVIDIDGERCLLSTASDITERKQAEEALRTERDRLETVTQNAGVGLAIISKDYRTLWANKVLKQIFGDVEGKICYSTYNQRTEVCHGCGVREIFKTGRPEVVHEQVGKDKHGKKIWSQIVATPIKDKEGNITSVLEVVVPITERKEAEEKIRESEEKYRLLVENANEAIIVAQDGWLRFVNPAMTNIMGYSKEELLSNPFTEFIHPEDRDMVLRRHIRRLKGEEFPHIYPFRIMTKDGEIKWLEINAVVIAWEERPATLNFLTDITERKRSEEVLRQSEERFRNIFENSPIALWEEDFSEIKKFIDRLPAKGVKEVRKYFEDRPNAVANCVKRVKVIDVNNAALDLFKAKGKEKLQRGLDKTFTEESYQVFREELICIAEGRTEFESEATAKTLKGDKKHVVVRWSVAPGYEKTLSRVLVSISDVTELKRAGEQNLLLETSRALSQTLKLDQVLKIAAEKMAEALKADRCAVAFTDQNIQSATVKYIYRKDGSPSPDLLGFTLSTRGFHEAKESLRTKGYYKIFNTRTDLIPKSLRKYFFRAGVKSTLIIPMFMGKTLLALFNIGSLRELRNFTEEEIKLAQTIANQVAVALQNSRLMEDLERKHSQISEQADLLKTQYREQKMLFELAQTLSSTLNLDQMFKFATQKVTELLRTERSSIILINPGRESATIKALYTHGKFSSPDLVGFTFDCKTFPELKKFLTRPEPLVIPDTSALPKKDPKRAYFLKQGKMKSTVAVALKSRGELLGVLTIGTIKKVHRYTPEEIQLLQTVANSLSVTIENSLLLGNLKANYAQIDKQAQILKRQAKESEILLKISQELSGTFDLNRILQIATKEAAQALQVDRCGALLAFPEEGYAVIGSIYVKDGKPISSLIGYKIYSKDFPQAQEMLEKRKSIHIPNVYHLSDKSVAKKYFLKEGIKSAIFSPMVHGRKLVGFLALSTTKDFKAFTKEEIRLALTIANQVAVSIENARLLELLRKSSEDLKTLSLQLINVQEDERKRIAQELHDQIGQTLFAMKMNLEIARKHLPSDMEELPDIKNRLTETEDLLSQTIEQTRDLTTALRPTTLDDFGLIPTLNTYIDSFSKRTKIKISLRIKNFKERLSSEIETLLYRITQEALTNVAKHAQATQASILLVQEKSTTSLLIEDNGIGFDVKKGTFPKDRLGLFSIKERVELLNGKFEINSTPNKGTKLNVKIPITLPIYRDPVKNGERRV